MRVLLISATASQMKCGIGDYTALLAKALAEQGCKVYFATSADRPEQENGPEHNPINWINVDCWNVKSLKRIAQSFLNDPPDVVHLQYPAKVFRRSMGILLAPLIFRTILKRPFVTTLHVFRKMVLYKKPPFLVLVAGSDHIVVTAQREKQTLYKLGFGYRTTVIPIGSNFSLSFDPMAYVGKRDLIRSQFGIGPQEFVLCNFGFLDPNKKLERVVEAVARLSQEMTIHLLFVGPFEPDSVPYHRHLKSLADKHHIEHFVHWAGYRESSEVQSLLASADAAVLLYPDGVSWQRGAFLAALGCGLPVIANYGDGTPDDIEHGHNVFIVSESNVDLLYQAIKTLSLDMDLRRKLGTAGRQTVLARPTWEQIAQKHLEFYLSLKHESLS